MPTSWTRSARSGSRAFAYSGVLGQPIQSELAEQHTPLKEYEWKLQRIRERLFTRTARQIAQERHRCMVHFFEQWKDEVRGIR